MKTREDVDLLRRQAAKAAIYLRRLIQNGDVRTAQTELRSLGAVAGQAVAMELNKLMTDQQSEDIKKLLLTELGQGKSRRSLDVMAACADVIP